MIEQAKNICIIRLSGIKNPKTIDINSAIDDALKIFPSLESERTNLYNVLSATFGIFSENYKILDADEGYQPWIKDNKSQINWNYWNRYKNYISKKIAPDTLNKLDNLTDDILDRIANPLTIGAWDKRGMVVGQVQSGKTSNYTGLINKAADAGYKLIVVLAGMHDLLRSQTQIRVDEGFIGRTTKGGLRNFRNNNRVGVGLFNKDLNPHSLTSCEIEEVNGDFNRSVADAIRVSIKGSDPIVAVIKKNGSILKNLITWLSQWGDKMNDGKVLIRDTPILIIDDEADNASINVSKEKVSTINAYIRALLSLFEKSAYIGYTATPFANIFIPLLDENHIKGLDLTINKFEFSVGQDLFPKDFIINIPAPSNYIGPAKIFGLPPFSSSEQAEEPFPLSKLANDYLTFIPDKHKRNDTLPDELPASLKYALKCFILTASARRVRNQVNVHNSMLVHVSRFIYWQDRIASLLDSELKFYQNQIELKTGNLLVELRKIWTEEFESTTKLIIENSSFYKDPEITKIPWVKIEKEIFHAISKMEVRAVHGDKNISQLTHQNISPLDYFYSEEQGKYLSIIAVGGDKLSRGLTLEGLTISYYLRAAKMYDTLMQMGRWFGYRPGYVDLCRIFTSCELINWYKHITIASEEMRRDFEYMFLLKKTPKEYGLKVRTYPGILKITSPLKFRYHKTMYLSYSGELEQTYQFKIDKSIFNSNYNSFLDLISKLGKPIDNQINKYNLRQKFIWRNTNNHNLIIDFLHKYRIGPEVIDTGRIVDYINAQTRKGNLVNWTVALINNSMASIENQIVIPTLKDILGLTERTNVSKDLNIYEIAKFNITDHKHELIDLSDEEIKDALNKTIIDLNVIQANEKPDIPSRKRIKWVRDDKNGLLIIYALNPNCQYIIDSTTHPKIIGTQKIADVPILGIAISFPEIENDEKIEYAVNQQFIKNELDYDDDLDQNDIENGTD